MPDGTLLPVGSMVEIELQKHDFNFGISLTQMHAIYDEPFRDKMLKYVDLFLIIILSVFIGVQMKKKKEMAIK